MVVMVTNETVVGNQINGTQEPAVESGNPRACRHGEKFRIRHAQCGVVVVTVCNEGGMCGGKSKNGELANQ